jgi:hypothetical protein
MSDMSKFEKAQAASEARDAATSRAAGSSAAAVAAAMRRYLNAEQYHELREEEGDAASERISPDQPE